MQKHSDVILNQNGRPMPGLRVVVDPYVAGAAPNLTATSTATIYAIDGGPAVQSVLTDAGGRFSFYAADGRYNLTVTGAGITPYLLADVTLNDPGDEPLTPERFGAKGGGIADDTVAIQAAIDAAFAAGKSVAAVGTYKTTGKITIKGRADFSQATFEVSGSPAVALEVSTGNPATYVWKTYIWLPKLVNMGKAPTGWAGQGVGVRIANVYSCRIYVNNIKNFAVGLQCMPVGGIGNGYNTYDVGHLENNAINLDLNPGVSTSWVNENLFLGGRYSHYSNEGSNVAGTRHIRMTVNDQWVNNNLFVKPSIEGDVCEYHVECGGSWNTIQQGRWEATTPKVLYTSGASALQGCNNVIDGGYDVNRIVVSFNGGSGGKGNQIRSVYGDSTSVRNVAGHALRNHSSSTYAIHSFYESGVQPDGAGASAWSVQHGAYSLKGKQTADVGSRVILQYTTGRLYLGSGAIADASQAAYFGASGVSNLGVNAHFVPLSDNILVLGSSALRWQQIYAATSAINTSDEREKQDIRPLSDAEKRVALALKSSMRAYRFRDAVASKGDSARIHFGTIAQAVKAAFEAEDLVAEHYGVLCYDEWEDQYETGEDGTQQLSVSAGSRYGVRYDELLSFVIAAL